MSQQLLVDLYGCKSEVLDDLENVVQIAREAIKDIGADIVEECSHKFEPVGVTYIAVITTSHFSIHTWPEYGYAAIDVFSCKEDVPQNIIDFLADKFSAKEINEKRYERIIDREMKY